MAFPTMTIEKIELFNNRHTIAFSTLRTAKNPQHPYDGFNICHYTGDKTMHIADCRNALADLIDVTADKLIIPRQNHSANVAVINSFPIKEISVENIDALITNIPGIALCINTADCVPIVITDLQAGIIAAVHSGWRGTVAKIAVKTIKEMILLGAKQDRIKVVMGPSICAECFEVGEEVAELFRNSFPGSRSVIDSYPKPHIDLSRAICAQLTEAGIQTKNIISPPICSHCNPDRLFSARHLGINSGRTATVAMLR